MSGENRTNYNDHSPMRRQYDRFDGHYGAVDTQTTVIGRCFVFGKARAKFKTEAVSDWWKQTSGWVGSSSRYRVYSAGTHNFGLWKGVNSSQSIMVLRKKSSLGHEDESELTLESGTTAGIWLSWLIWCCWFFWETMFLVGKTSQHSQ